MFSRNPRIRTDGIVHMRSRDLHLLRKVAWSKLWYHLLRQHRSGHVDGFPMCQHGGLDARSVFGKLLSFFQSFSSSPARARRRTVGQDRQKRKERRRSACTSGLLVDKQQKTVRQVQNINFSLDSQLNFVFSTCPTVLCCLSNRGPDVRKVRKCM